MAATDIYLTGLAYVPFNAANSVEVVICGLNMGQYIVDSNGGVTVPINSDPDGLGDGAYFKQFDVGPWDSVTWGDATTELTVSVNGWGEATIYVPVTIGYVYTAIGQVMRPATEAEMKVQSGPGFGMFHRIWAYGVDFLNSVGVSIGTNMALNNADPVPFKVDNGVLLNHTAPFTGVVYSETEDNDSYENSVYWLSTGAYPCTVRAVTTFLSTEPR